MRRATELGLVCWAVAAGVTATAPTAAALTQAAWTARVQSADRYAEARIGRISFALIDDDGRFHGRRPDAVVHAASLLKPMLLVAYLREPAVRGRALSSWERSVLGPMIRRSDNAAAATMLALVAREDLERLARRAHMTHFRLVLPYWGHSETTARDQARFFYRIRTLLPPRHRAYGLGLLKRIVRSQRWGLGRIEHPGWQLYFKGGWSDGTGRVDHQVGLLTAGGASVTLAVTTRFSPSHAYGKRTLRGTAARLVGRLAVPTAFPGLP